MKQLTRFELIINSVIASLVPWLAPIPTAYSVYRAGISALGWPAFIAILGALAIEGLGMAAASTALQIYNYQSGRRKSDVDASNQLGIAVLAGCIYLVATWLFIALAEVPGVTGAIRYVPLVFPLMSLSGVIILALRANYAQIVLSIADEKEQARKDRNSSRNPKPEIPEKPESSRITFSEFLEKSKSERITAGMLIGKYGIRKSTAYDWIKKLEAVNDGNK